MFDLEKLYIPPQLDRSLGLYGNQLLCEREVLDQLDLDQPARSHLLDMGCGRGRISHDECEQDIPPTPYTVAVDLSCCTAPDGPDCTSGVPSVSTPGGVVYMNGEPCEP